MLKNPEQENMLKDMDSRNLSNKFKKQLWDTGLDSLEIAFKR